MTLTGKELFEETEKELDKHSPTLCVAKWNQVTLHLSTGTNHSCHHPGVHPIELDEIEQNPSAVHNTNFKKEQRKLMLEGQRPSECDYCWRVEDNKVNSKDTDSKVYSDRITKSSDKWARPYISNIAQTPWDANVNPTYIEVDFDTTCNFKCAYCGPSFSTTWMQEIKQHGPYNLEGMMFNWTGHLSKGRGLPILQSEENPYLDAFWKWWPDAVKDLQVFRITGGEPLLSKNTFRVLDFLEENPQPHMEFNVNSNLGIPDDILDTFITKIARLQANKSIKSFKLFTSNEAHGKRAEYIRFGLNYDKWYKNCDRILSEIPDSNLTLMCTYNLLGVTSFTDLLRDMLELKNKYAHGKNRVLPLSVDTPYLRNPEFLAAWGLTENFLEYIEDSISFMYRNKEHMHWPPLCAKGFYEYEIHRMERLYYLVRDNMGDTAHNRKLRRNFATFVQEYDRRRGTDFIKTFPELEGFYYYCLQGNKEETV